MKRIVVLGSIITLAGCGAGMARDSGSIGPNDGVNSEVATSVVSGALNNTTGSAVGVSSPRKSGFRHMLDELNPIRTADAATWLCTGGTLTPRFDGAAGDPYTYTPLSCSVRWLNGRTASSEWSSTFTLSYGQSCDDKHPFMDGQSANCSLTRTTGADGNTRSITGPDGFAYAIMHNTNGAGTGWDSSVTPAPNDNGVVRTCGASGCDDGSTLVVNGSHVTGTVTRPAGTTTIWNHTVSTGATPLTVTGSGTSRVVTGSITTQHNIIHVTSNTTFNDVGFGDANCCFPTSGSVTTTFTNGDDKDRSESLAFTNQCGEATLTTASGATTSITLTHCL